MITNIKLNCFRGLTVDLDVGDKKTVVFVGDNSSGKTAMLIAIDTMAKNMAVASGLDGRLRVSGHMSDENVVNTMSPRSSSSTRPGRSMKAAP